VDSRAFRLKFGPTPVSSRTATLQKHRDHDGARYKSSFGRMLRHRYSHLLPQDILAKPNRRQSGCKALYRDAVVFHPTISWGPLKTVPLVLTELCPQIMSPIPTRYCLHAQYLFTVRRFIHEFKGRTARSSYHHESEPEWRIYRTMGSFGE
jgi:hypothetical protein